MWAVMAMLGRWVCGDTIQTIIHVDDGERACELVRLFGVAFLTALDNIDRAGKLKQESEFRDLGLVMSVYLEWSHGLEDYGIEEEEVAWRKSVVAYAKKAGIDLKTVGCHSMSDILPNVGNARPIKDVKKADRWNFRKTFKEYAMRYGFGPPVRFQNSVYKIGGEQFDITKWTSQERAKYAFDNEDPLKDMPVDALKEGRLELRRF